MIRKSSTLDDFARSLCPFYANPSSFVACRENLKVDRPILSAAKM